MARRLSLPVLLLVALALLVAGCGGDDGGSKGSLDDALGYMPKNAPVVVTFSTDINSEQYKNLDGMLKKFPFGEQVKSRIKQSMQEDGTDFEKDVKPMLGKDLVVGLPDARSIVDGVEDDKYVVVWSADGGKLKELQEKGEDRKVGKLEGADVWESANGSATTIRGDTIIVAGERADLDAAVKRHEGDDKLTEDEFNAPFQGLPADSMMRIYGDLRELLVADPDTADARRNVKWVDGLRKFAVTGNAQADGIAVDAKILTEGLTPEDLPLAAGDQSPSVARFGDVSVGTRDPGHLVDWFFQAVAANEGEDYEKVKRQFGTQLGIDVDRDLIDQFSGAATTSVKLDGTVAVRSEVKDPAAMRQTLDKLASAKGSGQDIGKAGDLLKLTDDDGDELYFGMAGDVFVASQGSPAGAKAMENLEAQPVQGAKGSFVAVADGETLAKQIIRQSGQNEAAGLFAGPLGDVTAWISSSPTETRMTGKLKVE